MEEEMPMASASPSDGSPTASSEPTTHTTHAAPSVSLHTIPPILPRESVFPIQIGSELFRLSGASLSSDAPSYFSQYFLCQTTTTTRRAEDGRARTLYIDRDPETFRDIALHLQGYHVTPRDGKHFVRLFADAQFYSLPKLISQLYEESIFVSIGHREFQIPRDLLTDARNSPNYFSLGFAFFFSRPDSDVFPGLDREGLLRPPSILPPSVPNRSADTFADLLRLLRGYPVRVRDAAHRQELLRDARYFHFKGLEQQLLPHELSRNATRGGRPEIAIRLQNVQKSGISVGGGGVGVGVGVADVTYARPYTDDPAADLVLEIGDESSRIHFLPPSSSSSSSSSSRFDTHHHHHHHHHHHPRLEFLGDTRTRVAKLLEVIATKLSSSCFPPATTQTQLSHDWDGEVRVHLGPEAAITLDGQEITLPHALPSNGHDAYADADDNADAEDASSRKRRRGDGSERESWTVMTGQWRLRILAKDSGGRAAPECVFVAVKIDAVGSERGRNRARGFLT